jgi:hypothetical protein
MSQGLLLAWARAYRAAPATLSFAATSWLLAGIAKDFEATIDSARAFL